MGRQRKLVSIGVKYRTQSLHQLLVIHVGCPTPLMQCVSVQLPGGLVPGLSAEGSDVVEAGDSEENVNAHYIQSAII